MSTPRFNPLHVLRPELLRMPTYQVANVNYRIKLDAMESPYLLPESVRLEIAAEIAQLNVNRYPLENITALQAKIREHLQLPDTHDVLLGNGSDELIGLLTQAVACESNCVMGFAPSFVMYRNYAQCLKVRYYEQNLNADFSIPLTATLDLIRRKRPALMWVAYPNNPSANLFDRRAIEAIITASSGIVVIDEAYQNFANASMYPQLLAHHYVVLLRTFSKLGLAGIRLGYLVATKELCEQINKLRAPYNVNSLTACYALAALNALNALTEQANLICKERDRLYHALTQIPHTEIFPSQANFLLFRCHKGAVKAHEALFAQGILLKNVGKMHPSLHNCLRVTVSTPEENNQFLDVYQNFIKQTHLTT